MVTTMIKRPDGTHLVVCFDWKSAHRGQNPLPPSIRRYGGRSWARLFLLATAHHPGPDEAEHGGQQGEGGGHG